MNKSKLEIKHIIAKEIKRHYEQEMFYKIDYKRFVSHDKKAIKHMHKRHELIELARKIGLKYCKYCGNLK